MDNYKFHFISDVADRVFSLSNLPALVCDFIGCQFALESKYGKSSLSRNNNNYCGMKNPLVRLSLATHAGDPLYYWAQYLSLDMCVLDYLFCLQYHKPMSCDYDTIEHFSGFISKFYCPEKDYIDKINSIYQQFKSHKNEGTN